MSLFVNLILNGYFWYVIISSEVDNMYNRADIANRIYIARKNKYLNQIDIGNVLGINQSSYSALELGKRDMTISELFTLADTLDVSINWLLGIDSLPQLTDSERLEVEKFIKYIIGIREK